MPLRHGERVRVRGRSMLRRCVLPLTPTLSPRRAGRGRRSECNEQLVDRFLADGAGARCSGRARRWRSCWWRCCCSGAAAAPCCARCRWPRCCWRSPTRRCGRRSARASPTSPSSSSTRASARRIAGRPEQTAAIRRELEAKLAGIAQPAGALGHLVPADRRDGLAAPTCSPTSTARSPTPRPTGWPASS